MIAAGIATIARTEHRTAIIAGTAEIKIMAIAIVAESNSCGNSSKTGISTKDWQ